MFKGPGFFKKNENRRKCRVFKGLSNDTTHTPPPLPLDSTFKVPGNLILLSSMASFLLSTVYSSVIMKFERRLLLKLANIIILQDWAGGGGGGGDQRKELQLETKSLLDHHPLVRTLSKEYTTARTKLSCSFVVDVWITAWEWRFSCPFLPNTESPKVGDKEDIKGAQAWDIRSLGFSWFLRYKVSNGQRLWG